MFDNNMNNNENFNNGTPLFSNNQNNIGINNGYNSNETTSFDNNQNSGFVEPWQQNNNAFNNVTQNNAMYNNVVPESSYNSELPVSSDIPPDLGEIKNLSEASVASAPTMEVLSPMNIMPESLPQKQDPLDAYENGNLNPQGNIGNMNMGINNSFPQQNYNTQNPSLTYPETQPNLSIFNPNNNLINNNYPNINNNVSMPMQNQAPLQENSYQTPIENQNIYQTNSMPNLNNFGYNPMGMQNPINVETNDSSNNPLSSLDNNYNLSSDEPGTRENDYSINSENMNAITKEEIQNDFEDTKDDSTTASSSVLVSEESKDELEDTEKDEATNATFNNDESKELELSDKETTETNLEDLGIEADFSEPDTLEIMDIDNDVEQAADASTNESLDEEDELKDQEPKGLVSKNVDKIKTLIEELKEAGADIELEEFDFESMYQLIVKLKK